MKTSGLLIILFITPFTTRAQSVSTVMGARGVGMAGATSVLSDEWSLLNNVGGLAGINSVRVAMAREIRAGLEGADRMALLVTAPLAAGVGALGIFQFGDALYQEQLVSAGYGNKRGIASLGVRVNYVNYRALGFPGRSAWTVCFGGVVTLTSRISIGAHVTNLNQPLLSKETRERIPTQLTAGVAFKAAEHFMLVAEIQKDIGYNPTFRSAFEFEFHPKLVFRSGFSLHPNAGFFGIGFKLKKIKIDYAFQYTQTLAAAHQISVTRLFAPRKH